MKRFAYLDIEATHTNWNDREIIEIAFLIKDENGKDIDFFESLVRPTNEIDEKITELTGITKNMLANAPEFNRLAQRIFDKLEDTIIVAHKIEFDFEILQEAFTPLGLTLTNKKVCTLELAQKQISDLYSYSLKNLCNLFYIKTKKAHRAMDDALALAELHYNLRLLEGDLAKENVYLKHHKKLIENTPTVPGVVVIKNGKETEVFKSENLKSKLKDLLALSSQNKVRLSKHIKVQVSPSASLLIAGIQHSNISLQKYNFSIYKIKANDGRIILRVGKATTTKNAIYFTETKKEANTVLIKLLPKKRGIKFAYRDPDDENTDILEFNTQLNSNIKKLMVLRKNYLVCSLDKVRGKYQYTVLKGSQLFASFQTEKKIKTPQEIEFKRLRFKSMSPSDFMSFNHSLKWIREQRKKTDRIIEIKASFF